MKLRRTVRERKRDRKNLIVSLTGVKVPNFYDIGGWGNTPRWEGACRFGRYGR
jgi:hypothetical protein